MCILIHRHLLFCNTKCVRAGHLFGSIFEVQIASRGASFCDKLHFWCRFTLFQARTVSLVNVRANSEVLLLDMLGGLLPVSVAERFGGNVVLLLFTPVIHLPGAVSQWLLASGTVTVLLCHGG